MNRKSHRRIPNPLFVISLYFLTTFAGDPTAIQFSGISLLTTEFAPMIHPFPILTPGKIHTFSPIHTLLPIDTGLEK